MKKYSAEVQVYGNPINFFQQHPKSTILGVFDSADEAEGFILERETPDRYVEDLGGWVTDDVPFSFLYRIKPVPM